MKEAVDAGVNTAMFRTQQSQRNEGGVLRPMITEEAPKPKAMTCGG